MKSKAAQVLESMNKFHHSSIKESNLYDVTDENDPKSEVYFSGTKRECEDWIKDNENDDSYKGKDFSSVKSVEESKVSNKELPILGVYKLKSELSASYNDSIVLPAGAKVEVRTEPNFSANKGVGFVYEIGKYPKIFSKVGLDWFNKRAVKESKVSEDHLEAGQVVTIKKGEDQIQVRVDEVTDLGYKVVQLNAEGQPLEGTETVMTDDEIKSAAVECNSKKK